MGWSYNDILVLPQDLQDCAWSAPMREPAKAVGLSDVCLKKQLRNVGIVMPPQDHWNRVVLKHLQSVPDDDQLGL